MTRHYLACDLGAESGRLISGTLENGKLSLQEIHRFANTPRRIDGSLHWNIPNLILELKEGLRRAARTGLHFESISTDSWGVDYILFQDVLSGNVSRGAQPSDALKSNQTAAAASLSQQGRGLGEGLNTSSIQVVASSKLETGNSKLSSAASAPSALIPPSSPFEILEPIYHYRDPRTKRGVEIAYSRTNWNEIFSESGIQFMPINTLFQLASEDPSRLRSAQFLLGVGDAFNYFLTGGTPKIEVSMASTFQLYNPRTRQWSDKLINALQVPRHLFPEIVPSATPLGQIRPDLATELGLPQLQVIATCSHDTGAAVAGVPAVNLVPDHQSAEAANFQQSARSTSLSQQGTPIREANVSKGETNLGRAWEATGLGEGFTTSTAKQLRSVEVTFSKLETRNSKLPPPNWAYLSSGTWSLMGVELAEPIINDTARELNFTNEIGYGNSVRLLKNISGLWLLQECKRQWTREGREFDYATLTALAADAQPFASLINPASDEFLAPENMVSQFVQFCRRTAQPAPKTEGAFVRCALESLALLYRRTLRQIEELTSQKNRTAPHRRRRQQQ